MFRYLISGIVLLGVCNTLLAQASAPAACPDIRINEPSGLTQNGDTLEFRLEGDLQSLKDVQVDWSVSEGKIEKGQGTRTIIVRTELRPYDIHTITAEAKIAGLSRDCVSVYKGIASVGSIGDPVLLDEYGKLPTNDQRGRLDNALQELSQNPSQVLLILLASEARSKEKDLLKRVKLIKDHVFGFRRFPTKRTIIASDPFGGDYHAVRIYRVPPDTAKSLCGNCRVF